MLPLPLLLLSRSGYHSIKSFDQTFHLEKRWKLVREMGSGAYGVVMSVRHPHHFFFFLPSICFRRKRPSLFFFFFFFFWFFFIFCFFQLRFFYLRRGLD